MAFCGAGVLGLLWLKQLRAKFADKRNDDDDDGIHDNSIYKWIDCSGSLSRKSKGWWAWPAVN